MAPSEEPNQFTAFISDLYSYVVERKYTRLFILLAAFFLLASVTLLPIRPSIAWLPFSLAVICAVIAVKVRDPGTDARLSLVFKGQRFFNSTDSSLFSRLGRDAEIKDLHDWILSEQVAVIIVWGPTGSGKTSLVNAGLHHALEMMKREQVTAPSEFYLDANQHDFEASLFEGLQQNLDLNTQLYSNLSDLLRGDRSSRQVIVIDNADQLTDDGCARLLSLVQLLIAARPHYRRCFVLVLDELVYRQFWQHQAFSPTVRSALKELPVKRFTPDDAIRVAEVMREESHVPLSEDLLREIASDLSNISSGGLEVSPLGLSIALERLVRKSKERSRRGLERMYKTLGGANGLLIDVLVTQLKSTFPRAYLKIIAALAKLAETPTREVRSDVLGSSSLIPAELSQALERLSSSEMRVLRGLNHTSSVFRILDDWLPALRAFNLASASDGSEVEIRLLMKLASFERLLASNDMSSKRRVSTLKLKGVILSLAELRNRGELRKLASGPSAEILVALIRESKRYYYVWSRRFASVLAIAGALVLGAYWMYSERLARERLSAWGLPVDLSRYGPQLTEISIPGDCLIDRLDWLPRDLKRLSIHSGNVRSLLGVPQRLEFLDLKGTRVSSLRDVPASVTELSLPESGISQDELKRLPRNRMLTLNADGLYLVDLRVVPDWVINLSLQSADITSLQGLPTSLQTLRVKGAPVRNLEVIPGRLRSLTLVTSVFDHIDYVPPHLATLDLTCIGGPCELKSAVIPNSVRTLKVAGVKLERVPPSVVELTVAKARVTVSFPDGLEALSTDVPISSLGIVRLAPTLRRLAMALSEGAALPPLPASLLELDISGSKGRVSLPELPTSLRVLNVSGVKFEGELRVPKSIEVLIFNHCDANEVHNLPSRLKKLDLAGCRNVQLSGPLPATLEELNLRETDVKELGPLPSGLRRLDISNSGLYERLPQLPTRLEELILNRGQFVSLKGLPKSVRRLIFVPSRPQPDGDG